MLSTSDLFAPVVSGFAARWCFALAATVLVVMMFTSGCAHRAKATSAAAPAPPPVQPWQREYLSRPALRFDDGLEAWFNQHMFSSREGADGAYGTVGGGCGCN